MKRRDELGIQAGTETGPMASSLLPGRAAEPRTSAESQLHPCWMDHLCQELPPGEAVSTSVMHRQLGNQAGPRGQRESKQKVLELHLWRLMSLGVLRSLPWDLTSSQIVKLNQYGSKTQSSQVPEPNFLEGENALAV